MADVTAEKETPSSAMTTRGGRNGGELQTDRGQTTIADPVVTKVAGIAAREVGGVHALGGGVARALGAVTQRLPVGDATAQGVSVEVGEKEAAVDLTVVIDYGESIPQVTESIRDNVIRRIEGITGLRVTEVNVAVNDLYLPGDDDQPEPTRVQ
jgi:uncharacterized alkaline shock family protein YloU